MARLTPKRGKRPAPKQPGAPGEPSAPDFESSVLQAAATSSNAAAAEHGAENAYKTTSVLNAMSEFLTLCLNHFAKDLTANEREYAVYLAIYNASTQPKSPGDQITLGDDEGTLYANLWDCISLTKNKIAKDTSNFIKWANLCQAHREEVAQHKTASAAEQGFPGALSSWRGGLDLSEIENKECFKMTMKYPVVSNS